MTHIRAILIGLMLVLATILPALAAGNENVSKLISNGQGKASTMPDLVVVTLGVETRNISASAAAVENGKLMNSTVNALLLAGVKKKDIQTSYYSLAVQSDDNTVESTGAARHNKPPEFVATNQVTARMNVSEDMGKILDAAIAAGSNSVMGISFDLRDPKIPMDKALADAVKDASRKAEIMAFASGVKLGRILELSEGYSFTSANSPRAYMDVAASTPVLPGEIEVTASVTITYEIAKSA